MDDHPQPDVGRPEVWLLHLSAVDTADPAFLDLSVLDEHERARGDSFVRRRDAFRYLAAHVLLRQALAAHLRVPPAQIRYARASCPNCGRAHGRPRVVADRAPHFSLSHSGGMVLAAVAPESVGPLGIDVQHSPSLSTAELCAHLLHPAERTELERASDQQRAGTFGQIWARKEAYLKAIGTGLCRSPRLDYVGADRTRWPNGWTGQDLNPGLDHLAAIALSGGEVAPDPIVPRRVGLEALAGGNSAAAQAGSRQMGVNSSAGVATKDNHTASVQPSGP